MNSRTSIAAVSRFPLPFDLAPHLPFAFDLLSSPSTFSPRLRIAPSTSQHPLLLSAEFNSEFSPSSVFEFDLVASEQEYMDHTLGSVLARSTPHTILEACSYPYHLSLPS
ncbi:uncharacterized protein SCHCODRAFT_02574029 [Schizophyllum commune H4-8]|nr:uncharacterized protein SCHCODRAFT_02574029 [Schizophyllum commune H4-8]KAI5892983.1 hypothetical protein SCHCODRAFT_02574029 [Schizophyllum commune H4-8]